MFEIRKFDNIQYLLITPNCSCYFSSLMAYLCFECNGIVFSNTEGFIILTILSENNHSAAKRLSVERILSVSWSISLDWNVYWLSLCQGQPIMCVLICKNASIDVDIDQKSIEKAVNQASSWENLAKPAGQAIFSVNLLIKD